MFLIEFNRNDVRVAKRSIDTVMVIKKKRSAPSPRRGRYAAKVNVTRMLGARMFASDNDCLDSNAGIWQKKNRSLDCFSAFDRK